LRERSFIRFSILIAPRPQRSQRNYIPICLCGSPRGLPARLILPRCQPSLDPQVYLKKVSKI